MLYQRIKDKKSIFFREMKNPEKFFSAFSGFLTLFFVVSPLFESRAYGDSHYMEELAIVKLEDKIQAQNFILKDLDGGEVSLKNYRSKIVLLNFWATWCLPCLIEMPSMEKLYNEFKNEDFTILAIDLQEDIDRVKDFREEYKLSFPILLDSDGSVARFYDIMAIPTTYIVDREGYLFGVALGPRDWASESAFMLINQLLKMSPKS